MSRSRRSFLLDSLRSDRSDQQQPKGEFSTRQQVESDGESKRKIRDADGTLLEQDEIVLSSPRMHDDVLQITSRTDELQELAAEYRQLSP